MKFFEPLRDDLMVQQQISNSWEHMVGVIMLNQTGRKPVKLTLPEFLYWFPTPQALLQADEDFVKTKNSIINLTLYLDNLEITYNKVLKEYQKRNNGNR
jgi:adenine-specific DNA glycosylase